MPKPSMKSPTGASASRLLGRPMRMTLACIPSKAAIGPTCPSCRLLCSSARWTSCRVLAGGRWALPGGRGRAGLTAARRDGDPAGSAAHCCLEQPPRPRRDRARRNGEPVASRRRGPSDEGAVRGRPKRERWWFIDGAADIGEIAASVRKCTDFPLLTTLFPSTTDAAAGAQPRTGWKPLVHRPSTGGGNNGGPPTTTESHRTHDARRARFRNSPLSGTELGLGAIAAGPDEAMWFVERSANRIGRITLSGQLARVPRSEPRRAPLRHRHGLRRKHSGSPSSRFTPRWRSGAFAIPTGRERGVPTTWRRRLPRADRCRPGRASLVHLRCGRGRDGSSRTDASPASRLPHRTGPATIARRRTRW